MTKPWLHGWKQVIQSPKHDPVRVKSSHWLLKFFCAFPSCYKQKSAFTMCHRLRTGSQHFGLSPLVPVWHPPHWSWGVTLVPCYSWVPQVYHLWVGPYLVSPGMLLACSLSSFRIYFMSFIILIRNNIAFQLNTLPNMHSPLIPQSNKLHFTLLTIFHI